MEVKKITSLYQNSEALIAEQINAINIGHRLPIISLAVICLCLAAYGFIYTEANPMNKIWLLSAVFLIIGEIFSSKKLMAKRMRQRYLKNYGCIEVKVKVVLGDKITYQINGKQMTYLYSGIQKIIDTEHLLILVFPKEMIPLLKAGLRNGTLDETRQFLKGKISETKFRKQKKIAEN